MTRRAPLVLTALALLCSGAIGATESQFGELPSGAINLSDTGDVAAEICRDHLFDPVAVAAKLPAGFRLTQAVEASAKNPSLQRLLQAQPKLRTYAMGSLCFMSVGRLTVDGRAVTSAKYTPVAFWWASAEGPRDANMRGKTSWVQLASWYPSTLQTEPSILRMDPMAEFVEIAVEPVEPNRWRIRLVLPGETVTGDIFTSGARVPSRAQQPGYMSVPMTGKAAGYFSVFTYYGHQHRTAHGTWQATGAGVFSEAFAVAGEADTFQTLFQQGWSSRAGLYRFSDK